MSHIIEISLVTFSLSCSPLLDPQAPIFLSPLQTLETKQILVYLSQILTFAITY